MGHTQPQLAKESQHEHRSHFGSSVAVATENFFKSLGPYLVTFLEA